jgi:hypothetical protein
VCVCVCVRQIQGSLFRANFSNAANIAAGDIAFISCNRADYSGYDSPERVFQTAYERGHIAGALLYSTADDYCAYVQDNNQALLQNFPVLSMASRQASQALLEAVQYLPATDKYAVTAQGHGDGNVANPTANASSNASPPPQNPLGPSPSTAVAMIILYSITGIITALFLVIIITGAVRAHRHPERYGPRDVLGRPRQSRARGLGRAIPLSSLAKRSRSSRPTSSWRLRQKQEASTEQTSQKTRPPAPPTTTTTPCTHRQSPSRPGLRGK